MKKFQQSFYITINVLWKWFIYHFPTIIIQNKISFHQMKRGYSPTISKVTDQLSSRKSKEIIRSPINKSVQYNRYFCHYNNAVYMGGMSSYKKHGKGLLFHDDGSAVVTQYLHDTPFGHNIIFRQNSITSVFFRNNDYEIAYKAAKCIIKVPFNSTNEAHGYGVLIDYEISKMFKLIIKKGILIEKILILNREMNEEVFKNNIITKIIGVKHEQAFQLTFQKPDNLKIQYKHNKLTIGYFDDKDQLHGLAFKMYAENAQVSGYKGLYLKSIERGYYKNQRLETFGQKCFSNGNKYIGQFEKGQFHGNGILVCPQQMKWVYGKFEKGKLSKVIDSNNKKYTENDFQIWTQSLCNIHQRYRQRWIDLDIQLPSQLHLYNILKQAIRKKVTEIDPDVELEMRQDYQRLSRIQQQFQEGNPKSQNRSIVENELDKYYNLRSKKNLSSFQSSPNQKGHHFNVDRSKQMQESIDRTQPPKTSKNYQTQKQYRMQDPFKIELIKIENQLSENQSQQMSHKQQRNRQIKQKQSIGPHYYYPQSYTGDYSKNYKSNYDHTSYLNKQPPYAPVSTLYRTKQPSQISPERQRYLEFQEQNARNLRLSSSPMHRNYITTPPKQNSQSQRLNGKIKSRRNYKYQQPLELYPIKYPNVQRRQYHHNYDDKRKSPDRRSPLKYTESTTTIRNIIGNNYKPW